MAMLARRCGLLHDIGKAADHEMPKVAIPRSAPICSSVTAKGPKWCTPRWAITTTSASIIPYTVLVAAADACSASRPGARRETLERYIKRMEELETIATGFEGVEQAFAIQAGRELRVIASTKSTTDDSAAKICRDIAKAFEEQLDLSRRDQGDDDAREPVHGNGTVSTGTKSD